MLENIKKDWTEINKRIQKRTNLLQTLQNETKSNVEYSGPSVPDGMLIQSHKSIDNNRLQLSGRPSQKSLLTNIMGEERRKSLVH